MTYSDMRNQGIDIQCKIVFCYYDYDAERRKVLSDKEAADREIKYIYTEGDAIYIEVEGDEK